MNINATKIRLLFGNEFWETLEQLIKNAKKRIFIISAFIGEDTFNNFLGWKPHDIFYLSMVRSDNQKYDFSTNQQISYYPQDSLIIDDKSFHGKIYIVDNIVIIGSQNFYKAKSVKEGEFSTLFELDEFNSSLILYQALLKIIENENIDVLRLTLFEPIIPTLFELFFL